MTSGICFKIMKENFPGGPVIRLCTPSAGGMGLIPCWGTKILYAAKHNQKIKIKLK